MTKVWGATPEEWADAKRLAFRDLLPVVSNPHAKIGDRSKMRTLGKTPSLIIETGGERIAIGFRDWTDNQTALPQFQAWSEESDHGVCIQTRGLRALDIDIPNEELAQAVASDFCKWAGAEPPRRMRANSGKLLFVFRYEGPLDKRSFVVKEWQEWDEAKGKEVTKRWLVELLADGQQFVALGTHPSGVRYEWPGGFPKPEDVPTFSDLGWWDDLVGEYALEGKDRRASRRDPTVLDAEALNTTDPVVEWLLEHWECYEPAGDKLFIRCPNADAHSSDNGPTESAWLFAGTGGYRRGHFRCMHEGCAELGAREDNFFKAVGYQAVKAEEFDDLTLEDEEVARQYVASAPSGSPKVKQLRARHLPLPGYERDGQGRILVSLANIVASLTSYTAIQAELRFDEFRGELLIYEGDAAPRPFTDADAARMRMRMEEHGWKDRIGREMLRDALEVVCDEQRFNSAQEWLDQVVPAWDGVARLRTLMPRYFGTEDSAYTRAVGDYIMTAHAGRIINPGCKADMVPVLVGAQGLRKSSGIAALSPTVDAFSEFALDDRNDESARKMRGCLVGELGELKGLQSRDREAILSWVVRTFEEWTPKYKERKVRLYRSCAFWGSTNDDEFLSDPTGERRWLPAAVTSLVDVDGLVRDRLQLWAEARDLYLAEGVLYEPAERLARDEHAKFKVQDGWLQRVSAWLDDEIEDGVSPRTGGNLLSGDVLRDCLNLKEPHTKRDQMRVAEVLKKLGMVKVLRRVTTSRFGGGYGRDLAPSKVWVDGSEDL